MSEESKIKVIHGERWPELEEVSGEVQEAEDPGLPTAEAHDAEQDRDAEPTIKVTDRRFWNLSEEELEADDNVQSEVPSYVEELQQKLEQKDIQLREYIAAYKKEVGEGLEKTKERLSRDADVQVSRIRDKMVIPMLDVLDALERSVMAAESSDNFAALLDGVKMVQKLMVQRLEELGLARVSSVGQPFDPGQHEALAVAKVSDPAQDNMVVQEFKPGFSLGERVIRPAQVQVGKLTN